LVHNEKRGAASRKTPPNAYRLAEARMKSIGDECFSLLFAGSMSPFRAKLGSNGHRCSARAGACPMIQVMGGKVIDAHCIRREDV
jgi:hypothetical protein